MAKSTPSISFVGLGYVGLCSAAAFAAAGFKTVGIDIDPDKIEKISKGQPPIHEPQLRQTLRRALSKKRLRATDDISQIENTDITFITVGTPSRPDGSIDLSQVENATEKLGAALTDKPGYHLVVMKSTVLPGTTTSIVKPLLETSNGRTIGPKLGLAANPEFLKEGSAIEDTLHPDKVVIGSLDRQSAATLNRLYKLFYKKQQPPAILTNPETAEMIKYASNAFLATKISYINTMANICQQIPGVDVEKIAHAIGLDPRIGPLFLRAGPGYGGSCLHKDLRALIAHSRNNGYNPTLLEATEEVNEQQASRVVQLAEKLARGLNEKRVAILGLAFKSDTDDIRDAASVRVIDLLRKKNARVVAYDPMALPNAKKLLSDSIDFTQDARSALRDADCCIIMTEWKEFRKLGAKDFKIHMRAANLVDARRIYNPEDMEQINFQGLGIGPTTTQ